MRKRAFEAVCDAYEVEEDKARVAFVAVIYFTLSQTTRKIEYRSGQSIDLKMRAEGKDKEKKNKICFMALASRMNR